MVTKTGNAVAPTTTALPARVMLYQASQRPTHRCGDWIETSHGRVRVNGRLGQRHADIVESLCRHAEDRRHIIDGAIELLVDPARIRKALSEQQYSFSGIWKLLDEITQATIELRGHKCRALGHLIDHVYESKKVTRRDPLTGEERHLWVVRLGSVLVKLLDEDLHLHYDPAPIARLQHGISQAVARYVLTHRQAPKGGWHMDTVLHAVLGQNAASAEMRKARLRIGSDADSLANIGVAVKDGRISRCKTEAQAEPEQPE